MYSIAVSLLFCVFVVVINACDDVGVEVCKESQIDLIFGNGDTAECGKKAKKEQYEDKPTVKLNKAKSNKIYTLIMVDPDAPNPDEPTQKYWLHWLVTDIDGKVLKETGYNGDESGNELKSYKKPTPPEGFHRYQFYVAEQPPETTFETPEKRGKFDLDGFVEDKDLCIIATFEYTADSADTK